MINKNFFSFFR